VLPSVSSPRYGWGSVTYSSVGTVTAVGSSTITVDFPEQSGWAAAVGELLVICSSGSGCSAGSYMDMYTDSCRSCPAGEKLPSHSSAEKSALVHMLPCDAFNISFKFASPPAGLSGSDEMLPWLHWQGSTAAPAVSPAALVEAQLEGRWVVAAFSGYSDLPSGRMIGYH
jgi:hypothetical protein